VVKASGAGRAGAGFSMGVTLSWGQPYGSGVQPLREQRLRRYESRTEIPLAVLAMAYLFAYAWPILDPHLPSTAAQLCWWSSWVVWGTFLVDYLLRLTLAEHRWAFVRRNWFDLVILTLPMLRPLRALRSLAALRLVGRGSTRFARGRIVAAITTAVAAVGAVAALAMLDAERDNAGANIHGYGDAAWWAISTITTVGYGDRYPTTTEGRLIAAGLMLSGIALLGVITASLASWFVEHVTEVTQAEHQTEARLDALTDEIRALRALVEQVGSGDTRR